MADPASILGTVVGVTGSAAQLSLTLFRLFHELKDAPQTLQDFHQEIARFRDLLRDIETILGDKKRGKPASEQLSPLIELLEGCNGYLTRTETQFAQFRNVGSQDKVALSKRLRLLVKKELFNASRTHMQMVSQILSLQLQRVTV